jgi:putative DNA primase/helicase
MSAIAPTLRQYITWVLADDPTAPGKKTKHPADYRTGNSPVSAQDSAIWTDYETAKRRAAELGKDYGVGFAITDADQYAFIDIDHCLTTDVKGTPCWSQFAHEILALFPGAYVEISPSGQGLHVIFSYRGVAPSHGKRLPGGLEFYTGKRFATMTCHSAQGSAATDHTTAMLEFITRYAPPSVTADTMEDLSDAPRPEWSGPADDDALIAKMLNDRRPKALFGAKVTFKDLWERNADKLATAWPSDQPGKDFNGSSADQSLCNLLAFWTGCHGTRMAALWRASGLARPKLEREDYVASTVAKACAGCTKVYSDQASKGSVKLQGDAAPADAQAPWYTAKLFLAAQFTPGELPELKCWNGDFYHYQNGIYVPISRDNLRARIYPYLEGSGENPKPEGVSSVVDALASGVYLHEKTKVPSLIDTPDRDMSAVVVCHNGAWDLDTNERIPLSPNLFALNVLPFDYDPNAPEPAEFLKFLDTQWKDDPQSIDALQEIGGVLLTPYTHFQKLFFLIGPTRSGKGTILKMWALMLGGPDNVVGPTLASLTKDFGLQPLIGKLAAFIGDVRLSPRVDQSTLVERLLSLTGEDALSVPRKNMKNWDGGLFVRLVMAANELPHFSDESGAAAGRVLMLVMKESFLGREDAGLLGRLKTELPHILAWHARGRRRLFERGHFIQPDSAREKMQELADMGQPVNVFLRETCLVGGGRVAKNELFRAWQTWCATKAEHSGTDANFGKGLHAALPHLRVTQPRGPDGKQYHAYEGITLMNSMASK